MSAITPAEIAASNAASRRAATDNLPLTISWFPVAIVPDNCPAIGDPERTTWGAFTSVYIAGKATRTVVASLARFFTLKRTDGT